MPEASVVVELRVQVDEGIDPVAFEQKVAAEGRRAARALLEEALGVLDELTVCAAAGARQRTEPRWVATTFGRVRVRRYRVKAGADSHHPLDRALGLSRSEASPCAREMICDLACRLPYRQVAEVFSRMAGEDHSALSCWRVIQEEGARIRAEEGESVSRIFEEGEAPEDEGDAPSLVVVEADGTFLLAQKEGQDRFEVKTGVFYTGKEKAGGRRHRRWRLRGKGCYATSADQDAFGKALASAGFHQVGLHRAEHVLCVHDGLDEYGATFASWFPDAHHQIDHYHVSERIWEASGANKEHFLMLKALAFSDPSACARMIRRLRRISSDLASKTAGYIEHVGPDLHGVNRLPPALRQGRMRIVGSGVVEKHQDLLVKRRMKGRGMRWSRRGADHLLALQARRFCGRWPRRWGVVAA